MHVEKINNVAILNFSFATMDANRDVPNGRLPTFIDQSSPMNLVEFGTGLFLSKTPSEEAPSEVLSGYVRRRCSRCATPLCVAFEGYLQTTLTLSELTYLNYILVRDFGINNYKLK